MADASSDSWIADVYRLPAHKKWVPKKKRKKVVAWSSSPNEVPNSRSRLRSAESGVDVLIERRCCCCGGCRQRLLADGTALLSPTPPPSSYFPSTPECSTPQFSKSQSTRHRCITQRAAPKKKHRTSCGRY